MNIEQRADHAPTCPFDHHSVSYADGFPSIVAELRERAPLVWSDENRGYWIASSYELVRRLARDDGDLQMGQGPDRQGGTQIPAPPPPTGEPRPLFVPGEADGAEHDRYRAALNPMFTRPKVAELAPMVERHVKGRLERLAATPEFDAVEDLALPILATIGCDYLGIDVEDPRDFVVTMSHIVHDLEQNAANSSWAHVGRLAEERKLAPGGDIISHLATWTDPVFSVAEIQSMAFNVILGAGENTATLIAQAIAYIDTDAELRARLIAEPELMDRAVDEFLRFITPAMSVARTLANDVTVEDITMHAGERIMLHIWSANHDPKRYPAPERFDLARGAPNHLAFGIGAHFCLGSWLARLVAATTLRCFLEQFPDFAVVSERAEMMRPLDKHHNSWKTLPIRHGGLPADSGARAGTG
jgi:cytochrome P450